MKAIVEFMDHVWPWKPHELQYNIKVFYSTPDIAFVFSELYLGHKVERMSTCELEVDVVAADVLNRLEVVGK